MPLRCLLFSSQEEVVQPISQVLAELGIEAEYCRNAVDAVEKVTTQPFQIVVTDWDNQPEATFLLKTARDLKAALRPLTLAIVGDDSRLPEALRAGANSVLVKPIRLEQVRDTMSTACELLRAKQLSTVRPSELSANANLKETPPLATAAGAGAASVSLSKSVRPEPEKSFRAGEFLQSTAPAPGAQFVIESDLKKSMEHSAASEVDALTELEPMAASVHSAPAVPVDPRKALDSWAARQERLGGRGASPTTEAMGQSGILGTADAPSSGSTAQSLTEPVANAAGSTADAESEAALFSYMSGEKTEPASTARPKKSKVIFIAAVVTLCAGLAAIPRVRVRAVSLYRKTTHAGRNWLNPQPVQVQPAATQHESFGQEGDEYTLPVATSIPDATTDPSQIRVLPVVDPTAKPAKGSDASTGELASAENAPGQSVAIEASPPIVESPAKEPETSNTGIIATGASDAASTGVPVAESAPEPHSTTTQAQSSTVVSAPRSTLPHGSPPISNGPIPSSLRSQLASSTPEASGAKPVEAAMSSIEPVNLPESAAWSLLAQPINPVYPDAAKANGQRGTVILQVLIGRDGIVQDAKFLQGSLVFARAAIEAVKQSRFKPYILNGRAVSVQSVMTLNFKPPA